MSYQKVLSLGAFCILLWWAVELSHAQTYVGTASAASAASSPVGAYRVKPGDKLSIRFLHQPELNEAAAVLRPDGMITLQIIDEIRAAGLTAQELKKAIEKAYSEVLLDPVVTVSIVEFVAPRAFVSGQVTKPGSYELRSGQTVWQAITLAGGFTRDAHRKMVLHARPVGERTLKVTVIDLTQLLTPDSKVPDLTLEDGDYVFVPDSKLSRFNRVIEAFRSLLPGFTIT
ncbi:MAG TPA: polysaccharide biosynthesis/export family protein [Blastocatellia bacterium]|nr:polysaccharide biosynthesis/export family protein [Blastocatellia bacterium]